MSAVSPRYNSAPTPPDLTLGRSGDRGAAAFLRWGLMRWSDGPKSGNLLINARGKTATSTAALHEASRKRRCLIPADAVIESNAYRKGKRPYQYERPGCKKVAVAGLWERWQPESGPALLPDASSLPGPIPSSFRFRTGGR